MERELPSWMDNSFLAKTLQTDEDNESPVSVVSFTAEPAVESGNNYTSHLYRVRVEYRVAGTDKSTSLIVKVPISKGLIVEMAERADLFSKEPDIYRDLLPKIKEKICHEFGPKYFHCPIKDALVLKDMQGDGYVMCDRTKQLDYSHCKIVFDTIARFHAASVACYHDHPDLIKRVGKEIMYINGGGLELEMKPWFVNGMNIIAGIVDKMNLSKTFSETLLNRAEHLWESVVKMCTPKVTGLNVLNHGDMWTSNMLFKYNDSGEVSEVKFIDYQVCRYTTPVADLLYFTWTSANEDVRENSLQELYDLYLQRLNSTLEQLGCEERMSREELQEDMRSASDWILLLICNALPLMVCEKENVLNMEEVKMDDLNVEGEDFNKDFLKIFDGKHYRALLPKLAKQVPNWTTYK